MNASSASGLCASVMTPGFLGGSFGGSTVRRDAAGTAVAAGAPGAVPAPGAGGATFFSAFSDRSAGFCAAGATLGAATAAGAADAGAAAASGTAPFPDFLAGAFPAAGLRAGFAAAFFAAGFFEDDGAEAFVAVFLATGRGTPGRRAVEGTRGPGAHNLRRGAARSAPRGRAAARGYDPPSRRLARAAPGAPP
jgi:hypothetical protein